MHPVFLFILHPSKRLCVHLLAGWLVGMITENTTEWMSIKLGWRMGLSPELTQIFFHLLRERALLTVTFLFCFFLREWCMDLDDEKIWHIHAAGIWVRSRSGKLKLWMFGNLQWYRPDSAKGDYLAFGRGKSSTECHLSSHIFMNDSSFKSGSLSISKVLCCSWLW